MANCDKCQYQATCTKIPEYCAWANNNENKMNDFNNQLISGELKPEVRARTLITLLWRKYDAAGVSMGRSYEAVLLEAIMELLGPPDKEDVQRLNSLPIGELVNETRSYLSKEKAKREGLTPDNQ